MFRMALENRVKIEIRATRTLPFPKARVFSLVHFATWRQSSAGKKNEYPLSHQLAVHGTVLRASGYSMD